MTELPRKIEIRNPYLWGYHRYGWRFAVEALYEHLHCPAGILLLSSVDDWFGRGGTVREPWVGFVHGVPRNPDWMEHAWDDVAHLVQRPHFQAALPFCAGLFALSRYLKDFLDRYGLDVPVDAVYHPCYTPPPERHFRADKFLANPAKRLLHVGQWMRVVQSFFDLPSVPYEKTLLKCGGGHDLGLAPSKLVRNETVTLLDRVGDDQYDELLSANVVFLDLFDASANNTVTECIVRNTPLAINPLPAVVEYLGPQYPLYYHSLDEAAHKLADFALVVATSEYLSALPIKAQLSKSAFATAVAASPVYQGLRSPTQAQRARVRPALRSGRRGQTSP